MLLVVSAIAVLVHAAGRRGVARLVGVRLGADADDPSWARAVTIVAGPIANYLLAVLLFVVVFLARGMPGPPSHIEVALVLEDAPAAAAGLEVGDHLVDLEGVPIDPAAGIEPVIDVIAAHPGEPVGIMVVRDGQTWGTTVMPSADGRIGAHLAVAEDRVPVSAPQAAALAMALPVEIAGRQLVGVYWWMTGTFEPEMQGPVRVVRHIASSQSESALLVFFGSLAMVSTTIGALSLLPLPACAGGRMVLLLYEIRARRRLGARLEARIHRYGLLALLVFLVLVTVCDLQIAP
jgi:regulator of sigma E protease